MLVRKILFCHSKIKFISSRHRVISCMYMYLQYLRYVAKQPVDYSLNEPVGDELHPAVGPSLWHVSEWSACSHTCAGGKEI